MSNIIDFPTPEADEAEPITLELLAEFLQEHQIENAEELDEFSQIIHLMMLEPNVPCYVMN